MAKSNILLSISQNIKITKAELSGKRDFDDLVKHLMELVNECNTVDTLTLADFAIPDNKDEVIRLSLQISKEPFDK